MGTARVGVGGGRGGGECGPIEVLSAECEDLSLSMDLDEKAELPQLKHAEEDTSRAIDTDTHWAHRRARREDGVGVRAGASEEKEEEEEEEEERSTSSSSSS